MHRILLVEEDELIKSLNCLIESAIRHGGDYGGPYFDSPDDLEASTLQLLICLDLEDDYDVKWKPLYGNNSDQRDILEIVKKPLSKTNQK